MDDLAFVRGLRPESDLVDLRELIGVRETLLATATATATATASVSVSVSVSVSASASAESTDTVAATAGSRVPLASDPSTVPRARRSMRRVVLGGALAAAAVSIGLIVVPIGLGGRTPGLGPAPADAVTVLKQAAVAAAGAPDVIPRPDQFYFVQADGGQFWMSMDGTHDGEARAATGEVVDYPGCRGGVALVAGNYSGQRPQPCRPTPAYLADAPTTPPAMRACLQRQFGAAGLNGIGKGVYDLLEFHYLRPAARAAMFEALTLFPGLKIVSEPGLAASEIAVSWTVTGPDNEPAGGQESATLVFNRTTHAFEGLRTSGLKGEVGSSQAPTEVGIVDRVGELP